jgi:hypothetical protein
MAFLVINLTDRTQHVGVITHDNKHAFCRIMPKSRVHLPEGAKVDNNWNAFNGKNIRIIDQTPVSQVINQSIEISKTNNKKEAK